MRFVSGLLPGGGLFAEATAEGRDPGGLGGGELCARVASAADKMFVSAKRMIEVSISLLNKPESIGARTRPNHLGKILVVNTERNVREPSRFASVQPVLHSVEPALLRNPRGFLSGAGA